MKYTTARFAASLAALAIVGAASAQLTVGPASHHYESAGGIGGFISTSPAVTTGVDSVNLTNQGEVWFELARTSQTGFFRDTAFCDLTVDSFPVRVDLVTLADNARLVISGGFGSVPGVTLTRTIKLTELLGETEAETDPVVFYGGFQDHYDGNGLHETNQSGGASPNYYLTGLGHRYRMSLSYQIDFDASGFTDNMPTLGITNEYGGFHSGPGFAGYAFGLNYTPVPEPASFAALGVGAVALARRRRK